MSHLRPVVLATVLALAFVPATYVRRDYQPTAAQIVIPTGSRDRALHGKARRRARRAA